MHVAYVCPEYPPGLSANGISTYTAFLADVLTSQGHLVSVFCVRGHGADVCAEPSLNEKPRVYPARARGFRVPLLRVAYYRLGRVLWPGYLEMRNSGAGLRDAVLTVHREHPIDVLECPEGRGLPHWVSRLGIPVVVRLHAPRAVTARANGERVNRLLSGITKAERRCLQDSRFLSAPTRAVVAETEHVLDVKLGDVAIIPNPAQTGPPGGVDGEEWDSKEILFVGRTDLIKGFDVLIKAFAHLAGILKHEDVRLKVVGPDRGLLMNGRRRISGQSFIKQTVREPGVASRVEMLGPLPYDEVQKLRTRRSITVVPSRFENFSYTLTEAMAAGCPVVGSDVGGTPEIVQHESNGLLFRSGDPADLARQIERLLADEILRTRLARQAQADIRARYSPTVVAKQMVQFYEEAIDRSGSPSVYLRAGQRSTLTDPTQR